MIDRPRITAVVGAALSITLAIAATAEEPAQPDLLQGFRMDPPWAVPLERPASHDTVWLGTHGAAATLGEAECVSCHDETACVDCHAGAGAPLTVHAPGWLLTHGSSEAAEGSTCGACHTPTRFCRSCHLQVGLGAESGYRPPTPVEVHPPGWVGAGAGAGHAIEARADLASCAGCHDGPTCASCHAEVNPHGIDFSARCRSLLRADGSTCAACHTDVSRVPFGALDGHPECR